MENQITCENIIKWLTEILRAKVIKKDKTYIFTKIYEYENLPEEPKLTETFLNKLIKSLSKKDIYNSTAIYNENEFEILVREESLFGATIPFPEGIEKEDTTNNLTYYLSAPSEEYFIHLLYEISKLSDHDLLWRNTLIRFKLRRSIEKKEFNPDIFNILQSATGRFLTLKITSKKIRGLKEYLNYSSSFLFQLSYNLDSAVVEQNSIEEFVRSGRISRGRRTKIDEIEPPKRFYNRDLIYHYQMGVSTDSPLLEYLSYYHVAEHYFESVFNEDLINNVKEHLTLPDFSYRRKKDIQGLIKLITKKIKIRNEDMTFSELEALKLTLKKYVVLNELVKKFEDYNPHLIQHYKNNKVEFSNGDLINFDEDDEKVYTSIANRVYKTRNAIVHSKEGDLGKYIPFHHNKYLAPEVPLLRFISELIIISTSIIIEQ